MQINLSFMNRKNTPFIFAMWAMWLTVAAYAADDSHWALDRLSDQRLFALELQPKDGKPIIGDYQKWVIQLTDENGEGIENAEFSFDGGMEAHGHGLPSQPVVTQYLGDGKYLIDGMLFNMAGAWTLIIAIRKDNVIDTVRFDITLDF